MKVPAITMLIWFGLAASAAAQGTPTSKTSSSGGSSKAQLSEIRSLVYELQGRTEKLRDLNAQFRSLVEQRPSNDEQLEKWNAALERLLRRVDAGRAAVVETKQHLDQVTSSGTLPTALAKDVANAKNDAEAQRATAEQALAKNKPARTAKPAKQKPEPEKPPIPDDL